MARWWTSDSHFGHKLVAWKRGFRKEVLDPDTAEFVLVPDVEAHDAALIGNYNKVIKKGDTVFHLGDVGLGSDAHTFECMRQLNGTWHLITGNHDRPWPGHKAGRNAQKKWLEVFESVHAFGRVNVGGKTLLMSHFPYDGDHTEEERFTKFRLRNEGEWLLCGHTHSSYRWNGPRQIHVGVDAWNLKPVGESDILALMSREWQGASGVGS